MDTLLLMLISGVGYLVAYHTYGRFLAKKIFKLDKSVPVPSKELSNAIIDPFAAHSSMSRQALDSEKVRVGLKEIPLGPVRLREDLRAADARA